MLRRGVAWKLLGPMVLVSLALIGACGWGTWYLNYLHVKISSELNENVQSTKAAVKLERTTTDLLRLLRSNPAENPSFREEVREQNEAARKVLAESQSLANLERESQLVQQIAGGLKNYLDRWEEIEHRTEIPAPPTCLALADALELAVLRPCIDLRQYNADQIEEADRENLTIVSNIKWGLLAVGLGAPISGLFLGYAVARRLHLSIYQLSVRIRDAAGRLNRELKPVIIEEANDLPALHQQMHAVLEEIERVVEQLQQREREVLRAEQLAAVGQVAAGVAHELRNPLTSVKMLVQTGLEGHPPAGLLPEDLTIMESEIRRMEQCIQLFLDFARPPRSERRRTNLLDVVQRALALVEGRVRRQKVAVRTDLPAEPVFLLFDPEQIHQVLVNLLINALDALPRGGEITVEVTVPPCLVEQSHLEYPKGTRTASSVEVSIRDRGTGIPPGIAAHLFEPFVSSKESGLGLGLSICQRLIEAHGGTIQGANAAGGGAVFGFTLPIEEKDHADLVGCGR